MSLDTDGSKFIGQDEDQVGDGSDADTWPLDVMVEQFTDANIDYLWQKPEGASWSVRLGGDGRSTRALATWQPASWLSFDLPLDPAPEVLRVKLYGEVTDRDGNASAEVEFILTVGDPGGPLDQYEVRDSASLTRTSGDDRSVELAVDPTALDSSLGFAEVKLWMRDARPTVDQLPTGSQQATIQSDEEGDVVRIDDATEAGNDQVMLLRENQPESEALEEVVDILDKSPSSEGTHKVAYTFFPGQIEPTAWDDFDSYDLATWSPKSVDVSLEYPQQPSKQYAPKDQRTMLANSAARGGEVAAHPARLNAIYKRPRLKLFGVRGQHRDETSGESGVSDTSWDNTQTYYWHAQASEISGSLHTAQDRQLHLDVSQGRVIVRMRWFASYVPEYDYGGPIVPSDFGLRTRDLQQLQDKTVDGSYELEAEILQLQDGDADWSEATTVAGPSKVTANGAGGTEKIEHYPSQIYGTSPWLHAMTRAREWGSNFFDRVWNEGLLYELDAVFTTANVYTLSLPIQDALDPDHACRFVLRVEGPGSSDLDLPESPKVLQDVDPTDLLLSLVGLSVYEQGF